MAAVTVCVKELEKEPYQLAIEAPEEPSIPLRPDVPEVPLEPEEPELPDVPVVPEEPDVPVVPDVPLTPEVPDVPLDPSPPLAPSKFIVHDEYVPEPTVLMGAANCNAPVPELYEITSHSWKLFAS